MTTQNPTVTTKQLCELHAQIATGRITRAMMQAFLDDPNRFVTKFPTTINLSLGLMKLIRQAVGENGYINPDITPERFKIKGKGAREVSLELVPFLEDETGKEAAKRLEAEGYILENAAELAAFFQQFPEEVKKHNYIVALGKDSRWGIYTDGVHVPFVCVVRNGKRSCHLVSFDSKFRSGNLVLVSRK